jgi:glutathione-regulated potassium-efflux system ancillary protein KefC
LVLFTMGRVMPLPLGERPVFIALLAQGGEFGFVVFQEAQQAGVISGKTSSFLVAAVALSMLVTPVMLLVIDRFIAPRLAQRRNGPALDTIAEPQHAPVVIAGFGRYGQVVGRLLSANGLSATVLEHDADQVESLRRFGWPVFYGDAARLDLLRLAGVAQAKVFVLAIDDVAQSVAVAEVVRQHFPQVTLVARARNVTHYGQLRKLGVQLIERETFDSALMSGRSVLEALGWQPHAARNSALRFRRHNVESLETIVAHLGDEQKVIAAAKQGRQQLEQLWAQEREQAAAQRLRERQGWHGSEDAAPKG